MKRALAGVVLAAALLAIVLPVAAAAQSAPTTTAAPPTGPGIFGQLLAGDNPVEGVRITVSRNGKPVGAATSDAQGRFDIPVPSAGAYRIDLDPKSIPKGVELVDPKRISLPSFNVFGTIRQRVLFPFEGVSSTDQTVKVESRTDRLVNLFVGGVRFGLIVGVCSVGLSLVYGTTGLVNFAHGELVTIGALFAWFFSTGSGGPRWTLVVATLLALVLSGVFGGLLDFVLWRPLVKKRTGAFSRMLVSIGLALFLRHLFQVIFGGNPRSFREYAAQGPTDFGPISLPARDYVVMAVCAVALVLVALALERTRLGTAVRAVADERDLAEASGIDVRRVITVVWVFGTALTALGGVLLALTEGVQWNMGFRLLLTMFAAVVLGGLGSAYGAMAGGIVVGVASQMSTYWLEPDFKFAVALAILVVVLLFRPQGILGVRGRIG